MSELIQTIGMRLRNYRQQRQYSQEVLAERVGLHATYIGQVERGEKNVTVESLAKIAAALDVPLSRIFEKVGDGAGEDDYPLMTYELLAACDCNVQKKLYNILSEIVRLTEK